MMTTQDAERALELARQREALHKVAAELLIAQDIGVCDLSTPTSRRDYRQSFRVVHLQDELRGLLRRDLDLQNAEKAKAMEALGVAPNPLAEPEQTGESVRTV